MSHDFLRQLKAAHQEGSFLEFVRNSAKSGLLFVQIPELRGLDEVPQDPRWHPEGDVWTHTLLVIQHLPKAASFALFLAALFHDVGKAQTTVKTESGRITAHGHEGVSKQIAEKILEEWQTEDKLKREVIFLVQHHMVAHNIDANSKTLRRLVLEGGRELVDQLLQHGEADVDGGCRDFSECERLRKLFDQLEVEEEQLKPLLTGEEVMELTGLKEGPIVGQILKELAALGDIDREAATRFVKQYKYSEI